MTHSTDTRAAQTPVIDLAESRARIDEIDAQIVELFERRMRVAKDVADYKRSVGKPVLDKEREAQKIASVTNLADDEFKQFIPPLYGFLMEMSRSYQEHVLGSDQELARLIAQLELNQPFPHEARVACQGVAGAYSHIACTKLFDNAEVRFEASWANVCDDVENGLVDFGVLPLENSTAGTVDRVYDLLSKRGLSIVRALTLRINHDLLAKPGARLEDINEVFSHEQALRQCEGFIDSLSGSVRSTVCKNTAMAAQAVAESQRTDVAAISSTACAQLYGLDVLAHGIQDEANNFTRFICVARKPVCYENADHTSLLLVLPHEPGSLFRVLSRISALGINLIKLESRPIPGREFEFMFYVDIESAPGDPAFAQLALQLPPLCDLCCYLGSYEEFSA